MGIAVGSASEVLSPVRLRGGCENPGMLLPTWMSLLGSKPLAGASTRPRRVSMSGVSWFRSLNCSEMGSERRVGTPVPSYTSRDLLSPRLLLVVGALGHWGSHHSPSVHQVAGAAPRTEVSRAPRPPAPVPHLPLWHRTAMRAQCQLASVAPAAPCSYLRWRKGCHSAVPGLLSPGQRAAFPPPPHRDRQPTGSGCTGSPGGHRALHQHAVSPATGTESSAGCWQAPALLPVPQPHLCPKCGGGYRVSADSDGVEGVARVNAMQGDVGAAAHVAAGHVHLGHKGARCHILIQGHHTWQVRQVWQETPRTGLTPS